MSRVEESSAERLVERHLECRFAIEEMRLAMNIAADRFAFIFKIVKISKNFEFEEEAIRNDCIEYI